MIVLATSTVCSRSWITRYGESGVLFAVRRGIHCAIHSVLSRLISAVTAGIRPRGLPLSPVRPPPRSPFQGGAAAPTHPLSAPTSLLMSRRVGGARADLFSLGHRAAVVV